MSGHRAKPPPLPILAKRSYCEGSSVLWSKTKKQPTHPQKRQPTLGLSHGWVFHNIPVSHGTFPKAYPVR